MEDQASSKNWLANGNVRLAIIAAALILVLAGTQLGSGDSLAAVDAGSGVSDAALLDEPASAADVLATPTLTPTPVPVPSPEPELASAPELASEEADVDEDSAEADDQTPRVGTTLAAGTGGGAVVVLPGEAVTTTLDADLLVNAETQDDDPELVCVLPEVPAEVATEGGDDASDETTGEESEEDAVEGDQEEPVADSAPVPDAWFSDNFETSTADWQPLSGSWEVEAGTYVQTDSTGYDFITELNRRPPSEFRVEVDITAAELLNAGLILGQPEAGKRAGASIIDFTEDGTFLRWGAYEEATGQYRYIGGALIDSDFDPSATVRLGVERREDRTFVSIDGREIAAIDPIPDGRLGLVTSVSVAAFSNFAIEDLTQ